MFYRLLSLTHYSLIWQLCSLKANYCSKFWKLEMLRFLFLTHAHKPQRGKTQKTTAVPVLFCNAGLGTINARRNYVHPVVVEIVRTKVEQCIDPPITQPKLLRMFAVKLLVGFKMVSLNQGSRSVHKCLVILLLCTITLQSGSKKNSMQWGLQSDFLTLVLPSHNKRDQ